jgi:hypothetical protein
MRAPDSHQTVLEQKRLNFKVNVNASPPLNRSRVLGLLIAEIFMKLGLSVMTVERSKRYV